MQQPFCPLTDTQKKRMVESTMMGRTLVACAVALALSGCGPRADGSTFWERFGDGVMSHPSMRGYLVQRQQRERLHQERKRQHQQQEIERTIVAHHQAAQTVRLGETRSEVLAKLPDQSSLGSAGKPHEAIMIEGRPAEIYFFRSGRTSGGRTTNEEFTPYVFIDGKLMAIGWVAFNALDFPKVEGQ